MSDQEIKEPTAEEKKKAAEEAKARAKKLAAEKAKAAAEAKMKAKEKMEASNKEENAQDDEALAKAKAAAAAKAKAAAAAKAKAAALAKAKAAADNQDQDNTGEEAPAGADEKAKAAAAAKAKAAAAAAAKAKAAAAARAKAGVTAGDGEGEEPKKPSPNQPILDHIVKVITSNMNESAIEESYINELSKDEPTLVIAKDQWHEVARLLHDHPELQFNYLSSLHGVDYQDHMEVVYSLLSLTDKKGQRVTVRVKTDRENAEVPSVTDIWKGADWNERETYDLLGIQFSGHPNLARILLPDDWVGYPLRKDYEQLDEEV